jgi:hypothetical protein
MLLNLSGVPLNENFLDNATQRMLFGLGEEDFQISPIFQSIFLMFVSKIAID